MNLVLVQQLAEVGFELGLADAHLATLQIVLELTEKLNSAIWDLALLGENGVNLVPAPGHAEMVPEPEIGFAPREIQPIASGMVCKSLPVTREFVPLGASGRSTVNAL